MTRETTGCTFLRVENIARGENKQGFACLKSLKNYIKE